MKRIALISLLAASAALPASPAMSAAFLPGNLVVAVEGNGAGTGSYSDNQAAPLTLFQFTHSGTSGAALLDKTVLPQTASGTNHAISGEYGSSSEGGLQLSADGRYLLIAGYGVNAAEFNANPAKYGTTDPSVNTDTSKNTALGQTGSQLGQGYTAVPRVIARIGADGSVDTSTALYGVFNGNNPRSVASVDGTSFYVSGQGNSPDATGGVFYATLGSSSATAISGLDTNGKTSAQDTRILGIHDDQLYVSVDSKQGSGSNRDFIGTLGDAGDLPTSLANDGNGPTQLNGFADSSKGKITISAGTTNGINAIGQSVNLSPESFFFANDTTLYVADSGNPKNTSGSSSLGDGGLQKWSLVDGQWTLDYTLAAGLGLVKNTSSSGVSGLFGLTGQVVGDTVELFATSSTLGDTDQSYLYGITDLLGATTLPTGESFTVLAAADADSKFRGVSFAPTGSATAVPEPASYALLIGGIGLIGGGLRRRRGGSALAAA